MNALSLDTAYAALLEAYGPQGWWPVLDHCGTNPTKTGSITGYHPGRYEFPRSDHERFEICTGAILTQNTAWTNVEKALLNLQGAGGLAPAALLAMDCRSLESAVRPSGYYRVKARKLRGWSAFYLGLAGRKPTRQELLSVWGVGPETADSILLYAYGQPEMVVDAYTVRVLGAVGCISAGAPYATVKAVCRAGLPEDVPVYQEFHALMVEHAKRCYRGDACCDPILPNLHRGR